MLLRMLEVLEPDEVARVNGLMFAAKRVGIIFGGAVLGVLITKIGISGVIAAQLVMLAIIVLVPLTMVERKVSSLPMVQIGRRA